MQRPEVYRELPSPAQEERAKAICETLIELWSGQWSDAQYNWFALQAHLPEEQRQRAINSVFERTMAAKASEHAARPDRRRPQR
jgi:hypothetical protein